MSEPAIARWGERPDRDVLASAIDAIFFETSATKDFPSETARASFRERWLGRYLLYDPSWFYVALSPEGRVAGYLAGCLEDPAVAPRFGDLSYFRAFAPLTRDHPAHLHVNVAADFHGAGVGSALVEAFARDAGRAGAPGIHVVTGKGMRNTGFYARNGFREIGGTSWNGKDIVLLGRRLDVETRSRGASTGG